MKKLIFSCAIALTAAVSFSSCEKETCYECQLAATSACVLDVCGGSSSSSDATCNAFAVTTNLVYKTNDDIKSYLETVGYACTEK